MIEHQYGEKYCEMVNLPASWHKAADAVLATVLVGGSVTAQDFLSVANPWLVFIGGVIGAIIGMARLYEIFFKKRK